jgi:phage shock protein PspC (stress-responsive transcriptional regulator)
MDDTRTCPYCAEEIPASAVRCRYCRSRVSSLDPRQWYRDRPERRVAGVAAAIARPLALPLGVVRVAFLVLTFVHFLGLVLYGALWLVIPFSPGGRSRFDEGVERLGAAIAALRNHGPRAPHPLS